MNHRANMDGVAHLARNTGLSVARRVTHVCGLTKALLA